MSMGLPTWDDVDRLVATAQALRAILILGIKCPCCGELHNLHYSTCTVLTLTRGLPIFEERIEAPTGLPENHPAVLDLVLASRKIISALDGADSEMSYPKLLTELRVSLAAFGSIK
jgi:hypothetical protein